MPNVYTNKISFPTRNRSRDPRSGIIRRHHLLEDSIHKAVRFAIRRTDIPKHGSCHTFCHSFTIHLLQDGYDIRTVQEPWVKSPFVIRTVPGILNGCHC